jgi:hypothetical protein
MMIPVETLELIQETAQKAQTAHVLAELDGDGRRRFVQHGDAITEYAITPPLRNHQVHSLVDLILFARRPDNKAPIVWHAPDGVTLLVDDGDRRDSVCFPLTHSKRFEVLVALEREKPVYDQARFVRLLRVDLGLDNVAVVSKFRKLDWSASNDGSGEVQHGSTKLAKSVVAKVLGIDELPDELNVEVPVYQQTGERQTYAVKCAIEIDTVNQRLQLVPLPDELQRVVDLAQASIHSRLTAACSETTDADVIPVYYGKP